MKMPAPIDITGQRFGRLTAIRLMGKGSCGREWLCRCDCGKEVVFPQIKLRNGTKRSCGCASGAFGGKRKPIEIGGSVYPKRNSNRIYRIYNHMKMRCGLVSGADERHLRDYRDRGITVCPEWRDSYISFESWALANGYSDDLTLDRIDNDKGYSPENCRWATVSQQNANKRH